ncbi:MAG: RNB domain-containing ribonuclease, partial [Comamonas sp.]
ADFIAQSGQNGLFRLHDSPSVEKQEVLRNYLKAMAVGMSISDNPKPAEFQAIAQATKDRPDAPQIHTMLLRSMMQAIYTPVNEGHFGLAFDAYTHFTSPIRRYPDLLVHRVIKSALEGKRYRLPVLPTPGEAHAKLAKRLANRVSPPGQTPRKKPAGGAELMAWEAAGLHCSANERRADEASRDVESWLKCKYMREHLGEEFSGMVTAVTTFGIFVTLDAMYVEGLVHITELGGDYFKFDEMRQELRGERSGIRYAIGSRLRVQVSRVDLDGRRIDFRLVQEGGEALPARGNSGGKRDAKPQRGTREERSPRDERGRREEPGHRGERPERKPRDADARQGGDAKPQVEDVQHGDMEAPAGRNDRGSRSKPSLLMPSLPPPSPIEGLKASVRRAATGPKPPSGKPKRKPRR